MLWVKISHNDPSKQVDFDRLVRVVLSHLRSSFLYVSDLLVKNCTLMQKFSHLHLWKDRFITRFSSLQTQIEFANCGKHCKASCAMLLNAQVLLNSLKPNCSRVLNFNPDRWAFFIYKIESVEGLELMHIVCPPASSYWCLAGALCFVSTRSMVRDLAENKPTCHSEVSVLFSTVSDHQKRFFFVYSWWQTALAW